MLLLLVLVGFALATPELCSRGGYDEEYYDGFCYLFVPQELTRDSASQYCRDHKSQLVIIDTKKKNDYIMFYSNGIKAAWMGLTCKGNNAALCFWDNHKPLLPGYSNFTSGHPNSQLGECVSYKSLNSMEWYSTPCDQKILFVCSRSAFLTNVPPKN